MSELSPRIHRLQILRRVPVAVAVLSMAVGLLVMAGWQFDSELLKGVIPGLVAMNPATAIMFVVSGGSLCMLRLEQPTSTIRRVGTLAAAAVLFGGIWQLLCDFYGWTLRFDSVLFASELSENRMAPNTAFHFAALGGGMLLLGRHTRRGFALVQLPAFTMLAGSVLVLVGYLFGVVSFIGVPSFIPMAVNTAALFAALAAALLCVYPQEGAIGLLVSDAAGGVMARRLVPIAVLIPLVLGWLRLKGQQAGFYGAEFGIALSVSVNVAVFLFAIWSTGRALDRSDHARRHAESELREAHEHLESRVEQRTAELAAAKAHIERLNADLAGHLQELAQANEDLNQKNRENETFVYSVSHDLRSPLVNLQGFSKELDLACQSLRALICNCEVADSVRQEAIATIEDDVGPSVRFIQSGVMRLSSIIDSLLRLSRAGRVEYRREPLNVYDVVMRIIESLSGTIADCGVAITLREIPRAYGDASAVEQVFANLVSNAIKYLDRSRPGEIEVGSLPNAADGQCTYYVRDNGLGIDPAYHEKIFQAFQRVHPHVASGEGMGLAIVRRVVERHGGRVWFESTPGSGTTFFVALPTAGSVAAGITDHRPELQEQQACLQNRW